MLSLRSSHRDINDLINVWLMNIWLHCVCVCVLFWFRTCDFETSSTAKWSSLTRFFCSCRVELHVFFSKPCIASCIVHMRRLFIARRLLHIELHVIRSHLCIPIECSATTCRWQPRSHRSQRRMSSESSPFAYFIFQFILRRILHLLTSIWKLK